jgi:asparagine synthase (glutamine-hydrolysing)
MANEDGSVWISFNGEIYNHADYRSSLEAAGHRFRSRCDTEAIVHLYEEHGRGALQQLRGMFAFAIWDSRSQTALLARDRLGIKPLYYAVTAAGDLVFASEIKALFASGLVEPVLDEAAVPEFFATGHVAGSQTLYAGVRKLPPGHLLLWHEGRIVVKSYWALPSEGKTDQPDVADAAVEFWSRFRDSVRLHLMADVPLGVFLSGGLDSSLIVAAMRDCGVSELRTFSVGFSDAPGDELPAARIVANTFQTDHHEVTLDATTFFEALPSMTWHRDQPLPFSASIPLYVVSELARSEVKVVLTGEGSDELFAGYGRYWRTLVNLVGARFLDRGLPAGLRRTLAAGITALGAGYVSNRLKRSFLVLPASMPSLYLEAFAEFDQTRRSALLGLNGAGDPYSASSSFFDQGLARTNALEAILRLDQATYLEELLMKQDAMSMAASIESRVPYLDHPLVAWAAHLPPRTKLRGRNGKALVREAAREHLPRSVIAAPKRGFPMPVGRWLRERGPEWLESCAPAAGDSLLNWASIGELLNEHRAGLDHTGRLWRLLAFQTWRRDTLARHQALVKDALVPLTSAC